MWREERDAPRSPTYRLRPKSFVYKYAGEQEIKERGRRGAPRESDGENRVAATV